MNYIRCFFIFCTFFLTISLEGQDSLEIPVLIDSSVQVADLEVLSSATDDVYEEEIKPPFYKKLFANYYFPLAVVLLSLMTMIFFAFRSVARGLQKILEEDATLSPGSRYDTKEKYSEYHATVKTLRILTPGFFLAYLLYVAVVDTSMQGYVMEWTNLLVRWAHVVAGIMWIGASFYFIFLENNLNRTKGIRDELAGNLWAVHGGGFYFLEKYKVAPKIIPKDLHWFKYEAYFTLITGFSLLTVVYYMDAQSYLLDPSKADLSIPAGIAIGVGTLIFGWIVYDFLCKSPLIKRQGLFALVGFIFLIGVSFFLSQVFSSRAAYIHVGALIGTIMVGNVYFNIIPAQKAMVRSATIGEPLDASLGKKAGERSLHNNYLTLPVVFIMISNHFPSTFGHEYNWAVLMVITLASAGIKHYWNLLDRGIVKTKILVLSVVTIFSLVLVSSPMFEDTIGMAIPVSFSEANGIIQTRCIQCHSASPSDDVWTKAPNGVMYDTPQQIKNMADKIMVRAVRTKNMPQGNKTNMTEEERTILKRWILQGAKIDQ